MIKASCDHGEISIKADGDVFEIYADVMTIIGAVYDSIYDKDSRVAEVFKEGVTDNIATAFKLIDERRELNERRDEYAESDN